MKITETKLKGLFVIEPTVFEDERGFFLESYHYQNFKDAGIDVKFIQDNHSKSVKNTLRGLHFQKEPKAQDKLIRCIAGEIYDAVVDIRKDSETYGQWFGINLSAENKKQLFVPKGFAHGFYVLSDTAEIVYKCSELYSPEHENGISWNDPDVGIEWPLTGEPILSEKDSKLLLLSDL